MEQIKNDNKPQTGQTIERMSKTQKRVARTILNNTGMIVGFFIIFVVIVVFTTDVKLTGAMQWAELGLVFFILLFCSYSMYVNYANSGTRAGRKSDLYIDSYINYNDKKKYIIDKKYQARSSEFCRYYISEELKNSRTSVLSEVGIDYDVYTEKYLGRDKKYLETIKDLSKTQVLAIIKANSITPIKLTPEMIMKRGRGNSSREPLGTKPETKKRIHLGTKFVSTCITSFVTGVIVLDVIINPTWATFVACCLKVLLVVLNGFMGYKMGYENIVVDTVEYMNDQVDLMNQLIQYVEDNPQPKDIENNKTVVDDKKQEAVKVDTQTQSEAGQLKEPKKKTIEIKSIENQILKNE